MCKFVNIPAYGTDTFLRYQLRAALKEIKADDRLIASEGVSTLTYDELRAACRSRGMRWDGESTNSMRKQLEDWLELSLGAALPSSLLILSRAFTITHQRLEDAEAAAVSDLEATLASLPDEVLKKVEMEACATEDSAAQKLRRLESLRHEEEMIAEEAADRQDAAQAVAACRDIALEEMQTPAEVLKSESQLASSAVAAEAAAAAPETVAAPVSVRSLRNALQAAVSDARYAGSRFRARLLWKRFLPRSSPPHSSPSVAVWRRALLGRWRRWQAPRLWPRSGLSSPACCVRRLTAMRICSRAAMRRACWLLTARRGCQRAYRRCCLASRASLTAWMRPSARSCTAWI